MTISTTPISASIGVEVRGYASKDFVRSQAAEKCRRLLFEHGVVVYREAHIVDADLVAFSRMLGEVVVAPVGGHPEYPEISPVTMDPSKSALAGLRRSTIFWHTDGLTDAVPQKATLLTAREIADDGGDTEFANTYAAYEALSDKEKAELAHYRVVHSVAASQLLLNPDPTPEQLAKWNRAPSREHPLVWTRRDGRKSLLIGATAGEIVGLSPQDGRAILDRILAWATQSQFVLRHQWRVGDLVVWDNTGMLHRATPYEPTSRRLMHRTTLVGEEAIVWHAAHQTPITERIPEGDAVGAGRAAPAEPPSPKDADRGPAQGAQHVRDVRPPSRVGPGLLHAQRPSAVRDHPQ